MNKDFVHKLYLSHQQCTSCATPLEVSKFFVDLVGFLFPDFAQLSSLSEKQFEEYSVKLKSALEHIISHTPLQANTSAKQVCDIFFDALPVVYEKLHQDVTAMYEGDPAAKSKSEVIRTYPGFYAIAAYRIARVFYVNGVDGIPRIITEHAHGKTGIDIHPGAEIGNNFCIDHGTGIVIGETSVIGNHVKIYQGVTLGALSVNKEDAKRKRHPTLEDHVIVYAGATILGGETTIGHHSVVGGNVWLTRSVPPNSKLYYQSKMYNGDTDETDLVIFKSEQ